MWHCLIMSNIQEHVCACVHACRMAAQPTCHFNDLIQVICSKLPVINSHFSSDLVKLETSSISPSWLLFLLLILKGVLMSGTECVEPYP